MQQSSTIPDVSTPSVTSISDSESEYSEISPYEAAALQRREENRNLLESLGLIKVCIALYMHIYKLQTFYIMRYIHCFIGINYT